MTELSKINRCQGCPVLLGLSTQCCSIVSDGKECCFVRKLRKHNDKTERELIKKAQMFTVAMINVTEYPNEMEALNDFNRCFDGLKIATIKVN